MSIKDRDLLRRVDNDIMKIETRLSEIGIHITNIPAKALLEMVTAEDDVVSIDFIAFSRGHLEKLKSEGREGTANSMRPAINNLVDYLKKESIDIKDVTSQMLRGFEAFLKTKRKQIRINQLGEEVVPVRPGLGQSGVHNNMRTLRTFSMNAAGRITQNSVP